MRHRSRAVIGGVPRGRRWQAEPKPIAANPAGRAPRRRRRLGYFSGSLGRATGKQTDRRDTPGRSAVSGGAASVLRWAGSPRWGGAQAHHGELAGRGCRVARGGCLSDPPHATFRLNVRPIMVGQRGRHPRRRRRHGYFPGTLGRPYATRTDERETPGRSAVSGAPPPSFASRHLSAWTDRRSIAASQRIAVTASTLAAVARLCRTPPPERTHHRALWADGAARDVGSVAAVWLPAELDCANNRKSNGPETSERSAGPDESAPTFTRRHSPSQTGQTPSAADTPGDVAHPARPFLMRRRRSRPRERRLRDGHLGVPAAASPRQDLRSQAT